MVDVAYNKDTITEILQGTKVPGIEMLLVEMEANGFFTAPCSTQYHLACEGGLAAHSLSVYRCMLDLAETLAPETDSTDIAITALLHDLGKAGQFGKDNYVPNMVDSRKKDENGNKIYKQSEAKPFASNSELMYVDHEIRSVVIASQYIHLTEGQQFAILYHNGMYGNLKYALNGKETPLYMLLHFADMWSSRVLENDVLDVE